MALTGKTISQLDYLQFPTNDTVLPVEYLGDTFHINFSSITYTEGTYTQLSTDAGNGVLTPGRFYLMTDYQTCYDQPNFDQDGNVITTGNYKTGSTESLLLLAISTTQFSPTVYSTLFPTDKITYDITFNTTEVTGSPAKGRITERIDTQKNNRTDYDFRAVQFVRYVGFFSESYQPGTVSLDGGSGAVTGIGTFFTSYYSPGDVIGLYYGNAPISCFKYYEIVSIIDDTNMTVSGLTMWGVSNTYYSRGNYLPNHSSPFKCNITGGTFDEFTEYYTFNDDNNFNTFMDNNTDYSTFLLSNNVFKSGSYQSNTLGGNCVGNTFDDDMDSNTFGAYSSYNILTNDFDRNTVGPYFAFNIIDCDMRSNTISSYFEYNMIGDADGPNFDYNTIGYYFQSNFFTMNNNDFANNIIGASFNNNIIDSGFRQNTIIGGFTNNRILFSDFNNNTINGYFYENYIPVGFRYNQIGDEFHNNNIYSVFENNTTQSQTFSNTFGNPSNLSFYTFTNNKIGPSFSGNYFSGTTANNSIGFGCQGNSVDTNFSYNTIGSNFASNIIANDFGFGGGTNRGNIIGNGFNNNRVGEYCYDNTFGDECYGNILGDNFINNKVSYGFNNVTTIDYDSSGSFQNNNFTYGYFSGNLTLSGATGGNSVFYTQIPTNVTLDYADAGGYVTFLSGGTIIAQTILV